MAGADEVLLDDVLDVLDVGEELGEATADFVDDVVQDLVHPHLIEWRAHRLDRIGNRVANPRLIEIDHFSRPLDHLGR